ncbi:MAG TPA: acylneuraminate cytidylyltransferase family protein, partial [Candidatus Binatia bacterium]|nr:acylneuraminate cytidylyltransferase family protein [Candidatus Binatia bacterium]
MSSKPMPRIAALVPMRHDSERVPGKNYRLMAGEPLYRHIITTLLAVPEIGQVVIDTDSPTVKADAAEHFPQVVVLDRPEHLRDGTIPMNDVLRNDVRQVEADLYLQTHSTNPLLKPETIRRAIRDFVESPEHDSLFSVTRIQARLWTADGRPMNHDPAVLLRTQDLPPVFLENSCLYLFTRELLEERGTRIGARPLLFEIDRDEASDIDEEQDFRLVEALMLASRASAAGASAAGASAAGA